MVPPPARVTLACNFMPPSMNMCYRIFNGKIVLQQAARNFRDRVRRCCRGKSKIKGLVYLNVRFHWKDHRRRDVDNFLKALLDATKNILFEDDVKVVQLRASKVLGMKDRANGFEMVVSAIPPGCTVGQLEQPVLVAARDPRATVVRCAFPVPSVNTYYRMYRRRITIPAKVRKFRQLVAEQCANRPKILGDVRVAVRFYWQNRRHRDLDNHMKALLDATKDILFEDDCKVMQLTATKATGMKKRETGFEIVITPDIVV